MNQEHTQDLNETITKTEITEEDQRLRAMLDYFLQHFVRGEQLVYAWMSRLSKDYAGAYWHIYTLSNGGFYMAPRLDGKLTVESFGWQCSVELSADAAGICATLFAVNQLVDETRNGHFGTLYYGIRDYALSHPEIDAIWKVID